MALSNVERAIRGGLAAFIIAEGFSAISCSKPSFENKQPVSVSASASSQKEQQKIVPDLGLNINEAEFLNLSRQAPKWGLLPNTPDKDKLACPVWSPKVCMGGYSSNFRFAVNGPMADFMFKQSQLTNPLLPTKIFFLEDWGEMNNKEHVSGFTGITSDRKEIHIVMSLKSISWEVFQVLDRGKLSMDYFEGTLSYLLSRYIVHELGHAGAEAKKLAKPGKLVPEEGIEESVHPQVYAFDAHYDQLFHKAEAVKNAEGALVFGAQTREALDMLFYWNQLNQEAKARMLTK